MMPSHKQQVVALCIEAMGQRYAGKKNSGDVTILFGYSAREPVPAARVTRRRAKDNATGLDVSLQVLRDDLVNIFLLEDRLAELVEQEERNA